MSAGLPVRFFLGAGAVVLAWILYLVGSVPAYVFSAWRFILYDQGSYLYAVDRWQAGEVLYRDFAWQYGPLALAWYRGFAALGGNSPLTMVMASSVAFAAAWVLVSWLLVRVAGWIWGGVLAVAGLLPIMSQSGPLAINGPHGAVEMLLLACCASVLSVAPERWWRVWLLGVLAGLLQWVRFGPHAVALAAILLIVATEAWTHRTDGRSFLRQMWAFIWRLGAGYGVTVVPLIIWYFRALPAVAAWEQFWPAFMVDVYAKTFPNRWPHLGWDRVFFQEWLPAMIGVGFALAWVGKGWRRRSSHAPAPAGNAVAGLVFLPLYYAVGCGMLFHNNFTFIGHLWLAWPGLGLGALLGWGWARVLVAALVLPILVGSGLTTRATLQRELRRPAQPLSLPNGQQLWFRPREAAQFAQFQAALNAPGKASPRLAVFLANGGVHYFFRTQRVGRVWYFVPDMVRPWEEATVEEDLLHSERILVAEMGYVSAETTPGVVALFLPLPRPMAERLLPHLRILQHVEGVGYLVEVTP